MRNTWGLRTSVAVLVAAATLTVAGLSTQVPAVAATPRTTPRAGELAGPTSVAFFGDSIGYSAEEEARAELTLNGYPINVYDATPGDTIDDQYDDIVTAATSASPPHTVIIELGTNDAAYSTAAEFEADIRAVLELLSNRVSCVRWFTQKETGVSGIYPAVVRNDAPFNDILERVVNEAEYSTFAEVWHYDRWARESRGGTTSGNPMPSGSMFIADGVHLTGPTRAPVPSSPGGGQSDFGIMVRQAAEGCDPALATGRAWDVPLYLGEFPAVNWGVTSGIVPLRPNGAFQGRAGTLLFDTSRGDFIEYLWRLAGRPSAPAAGWTDTAGFNATAMNWGAAEGIVRFPRPGPMGAATAITRADQALWMHRYAGTPVVSAPHPWTDTSSYSAAYQAAFRWMNATRAMGYCSPTTFCPTREASRNSTVSNMRRLFNLGISPP